ncbi:26627_t:CDS:2, partial [Gigaspora margarita]
EELDFIKFRDEIESRTIKATHITDNNQKKLIQKKKLLVDNECEIMDYRVEEIQLLEDTKDSNTKKALAEKTKSNLSIIALEPTIIYREVELIPSQEKSTTIAKKQIKKPNKRKIHNS